MTLHLDSPLPSTTGSQPLVDVDQDDNTLSSPVVPTAGIGLVKHRVVLPVDVVVPRCEVLHDAPLSDQVDAVTTTILRAANAPETGPGDVPGLGDTSSVGGGGRGRLFATSHCVSTAARSGLYPSTESGVLARTTLDTATAPNSGATLGAVLDPSTCDAGPVPVRIVNVGTHIPDDHSAAAYAPLIPGVAAAIVTGDSLGCVSTVAALSAAASRDERNHGIPSDNACVSAEAPAADDATSSVTGSAFNARNQPAIGAHQAVHFGPSETYMIVDAFSYDAAANGAAAQFVLPTDLAFLF